MLLSISWKNVWRNKVRSLVVMFAVVFGMFGGIFSSTILVGMSEQRIKKALENEVCHVQIRNSSFSLNRELKYVMADSDPALNELKNDSSVIGISKRIQIVAMAQTARACSGVLIFGIIPGEEKSVSKLYETIKDSCGEYLNDQQKKPIVIGKKLAKKLNLKLKSKIILTCQNVNGDLVQENFKIVGLFDTRYTAIDEMNVYVRNNDLRELTGLQGNAIHEIAIKLNDKDIASDLTKSLKQKFPHLEILSWKEINPELAMMNDMMDIMLYIVIGIILLSLGFGIVNTMLMAILERTRELGMLKAIGMSKKRIFSMIMFETVFLTITGAIVGMVLTNLTVLYFQQHGLDLQQLGAGYEAYGYDSVIFPKFKMNFYWDITFMVIITGILASIYPAYKALSLNPIEAIRTE